jgi:hypothetical protein
MMLRSRRSAVQVVVALALSSKFSSGALTIPNADEVANALKSSSARTLLQSKFLVTVEEVNNMPVTQVMHLTAQYCARLDLHALIASQM